MATAAELRAEFQRRIEPLLERAAGYAYALLRNRADAEDAIQEALLKGFAAFAGYDSTRSFKGWWLAIVRNGCLDLLRRRRTRRAVPLDSVDPAQPAADASPDTDALLDALASLTPWQREILQLRYFGECAYRDIAAALGIPEGTVMSRLHAARQALAVAYRKGCA